MDRFIEAFPAVADGDLVLCPEHGVAYQRDQTALVDYGEDYFEKCRGYEGQEIADRINAGRIAFVLRHFGPGRMLDVGVGSGEFIKRRPHTFGIDVNPAAVRWLREAGRLADNLDCFGAYSFWDVLEHVPTPEDYLRHCYLRSFVFMSVPIMSSLDRIRESKHYRPGEHLYYWTERGLVEWMAWHGFVLLEASDFETRAGRESITSFAFRRLKWPTSPPMAPSA
jgi:SAM-dependent methyltransferase